MKSNSAPPLLFAAFAIIILFPVFSLSASSPPDSTNKSIAPPQGAGGDSAALPSGANGDSTVPPSAVKGDSLPAKKSFWEIAGNDTILVLTAKTVQDFMRSFTFKHRGPRQRGYGGGIGFSPGLYWIDMKPMRSLVEKVDELNYIGFNLGNSKSMISLPGGILYGGLGSGMRIGLEGRGGAKSISEDYHDTTFFLDIGMGYGGLLIEKAFVARDMNFMIGGMAGAGGISVARNHVVGESGFSALPDSAKPDGSAAAFIMVLQLHAACTYSLLPWMHIGVECAAPVFISPGGFQGRNGRSITDGFTTYNFGVQLRLILGNLG